MVGSGKSGRRACTRAGLATVLLSGALVSAPAVIARAASADSALTATVADTPSAPDVGSARQIALTYQHSVVVDSATTPTDQLMALPTGSMQLTQSALPVRARQGSVWVPINSSLTLAADGMLAPAVAAVPVEFSDGGSGPMARVQSASGQWLAETWQAGALPAPSVSGSTATYPSVFPGVDLQLTATSIGMSELLVVKSAAAAADPGLKVVAFGVSGASVAGATGTGGAGGAIAPIASDGLTSASPTWWDSSGVGAGPGGPAGNATAHPVADSISANQLSINAASAASAAGVTYPVYVDPQWTGGSTGWDYIDATYPTQAYWQCPAPRFSVVRPPVFRSISLESLTASERTGVSS